MSDSYNNVSPYITPALFYLKYLIGNTDWPICVGLFFLGAPVFCGLVWGFGYGSRSIINPGASTSTYNWLDGYQVEYLG